MTLLKQNAPVSREAADKLSAEEPAAFREARLKAWEAYASMPLPSREDEAWRRTPLAGLSPESFLLSTEKPEPAGRFPDIFGSSGQEQGACLFMEDGAFFRQMPEEWEEKGVLFMDLSQALKTRRPFVEKALSAAPAAPAGKFEALSAALWNRGIFLYVPKNVQLTSPFLGGYATRFQDNGAILPRTVIYLEEGAQASYVDEYASANQGPALCSGLVDIYLGPGARLQYLNMQRWDKEVSHFLTQRARLEKDAGLLALTVALGGKLSKVDLSSDLAGQGAESRLYGVVFGDEKQHFTHHARQAHSVANTSSDLLFKAAVKGQSRSIFTGMIHIAKQAQKSQAFQTCRNLILSGGARAHAIPMLEILADDVKCGHGASVGPLDEDQRFYLMTRGLSVGDSERIIVEGFFEEVLQRIPVQGAREKLHDMMSRKLAAP